MFKEEKRTKTMAVAMFFVWCGLVLGIVQALPKEAGFFIAIIGSLAFFVSIFVDTIFKKSGWAHHVRPWAILLTPFIFLAGVIVFVFGR